MHLQSTNTYSLLLTGSDFIHPLMKYSHAAFLLTALALAVFVLEAFLDAEAQFAFALSILAGLSTCIGALIVFFFRERIGEAHLAFTAGIAGAVMLVISLFDMLIPAINEIGFTFSVISFSLGGLCYLFILWMYSQVENRLFVYFGFHIPQAPASLFEQTSEIEAQDKISGKHHSHSNKSMHIFRTAILTMWMLTLHNLPEGLAVIVSSMDSKEHGISIALAVALHNIPEGLAIAVPLYASTRNFEKVFIWTCLSGSSEPVGALLALTFMKSWISQTGIQAMLCFVGGIMSTVSCVELIPDGLSYSGHRRKMLLGAFCGASLMILDLYLI